MKEIYAKDITQPSLNELERLALWYNSKIGNYPARSEEHTSELQSH